jgi:crotonobetainyl-CoA:carnitine CoA-transferase CaiB-like acyl-CoA transferase
MLTTGLRTFCRRVSTCTHGPLSGVKILDLSRILAGPFATETLGDFGADVIKVERPGQGDDTVRWSSWPGVCWYVTDVD